MHTVNNKIVARNKKTGEILTFENLPLREMVKVENDLEATGIFEIKLYWNDMPEPLYVLG